MKSTRRIQKRSFLLVEVLVSLALISLCLFPLLKPHCQIRNLESKQLEQMFFEREASSALCSLKEELHEHKIPWEELLKGKNEGRLEKQDTLYKGKKYLCHYELTFIDQRKKKTKDTLIALQTHIYFHSGKRTIGPYSFAFNVEKNSQ